MRTAQRLDAIAKLVTCGLGLRLWGEIANRLRSKLTGRFLVGIVEENGAATFLRALVALHEARKEGKFD